MTRFALLALVCALAPAVGGAAPARTTQSSEAHFPPDPAQERPSAEPPQTSAPAQAAQPVLSAEGKETVALIRWAIAEKDLDGARELLRESVAELEEPETGEEPAHIASLLELDRVAVELGSLEDCKVLRESLLRLRERLLPSDHPDLLEAKEGLAGTRAELGDIAGAHRLFEEVLEARTRIFSPDHPDLLMARGNLAATRYALGDLTGAHALFEEVLEASTRLLPPDHHDLLTVKLNLGGTKYALGDIAGARALFEEVLQAWTRLLPPDHHDLLAAKLNLAATRAALDDIAGARTLREEVLEAWTRLLPPDHPHLLAAKHNLAETRRELGDLAGARTLEEEVLEARTRLLPPDHPDLLAAKYNLGATRWELGDLAGAHVLFGEVLETRTRILPLDHPGLAAAKQGLAVTRKELGDLAGAHVLFEEVLQARARLLPSDHPDLLLAQENLAVTRGELGDLAGARALVSSLLTGVRARARGLRAEAARPAREGARAELGRLAYALSFSPAVDPEHALETELFATLEGLRLASVTTEAAHALRERPELGEKAREIAELRSRLNDFVASGPEEGSAAADWRAELLRLAGDRDRAERELRSRLAEAGVFVGEVDAPGVGAKLSPDAVAVSYLRYSKWPERDPETGKTPPRVDSLLAFVVRPGGTAERVELGPAAELEGLVGEWRAALGRPLAGRGVGVSETSSGEERLETPGTRLRERILDPVLARAGEVRTLHVVLDDLLHLVPLDALPFEQEFVGERFAVRNEITLARLVRAEAVEPEGGSTLAGGIDYEAELGSAALVRLDTATPPVEAGTIRSAPSSSGFAFLQGTASEARTIAELYGEVFGRKASTLTGSAATKAALFVTAPSTRWLHLATHGWFAPEAFRSQLDTLAERGAHEGWQRAEETLTGFAPETLCGLALAGANRGRDAVGRVPGILTAEELATLDLRNCELAVLSACETNVGIRRAGQGIQSLQSALHAAGARAAITSLWKVDDAATHRLFELFYTKLWKEKLGKADALWQAKMALRAVGHPPRDWAGWILSGDPD